ncbi:amino acid ABC transporter substrate-binding protein [Candidatus Bipolaricaulota bacterium]|nr:amino acid ABC transporter substrate-binding protein [Candidatus Bipolaricaulota bacterium]
MADPYPPYQYFDRGEVRGLDHDLISAVLEQLGYQVETVLLPWEACLQRLDRGEAHGAFQVTRTPERERRYLFSRQLRTAETALFARRGLGIHLDPLSPLEDQLRGVRIGMMEGYSYHPAIDTLPAHRAASQEDLLWSVAEGRLDVVVMDTGVAEYLMRRLGLPTLPRVKGFVAARDLHAVFRMDCRELLEQFDAEIERMIAEGVPGRIAEVYGLA